LSPWNIIKFEKLPMPLAALIGYHWLRPMG